MRPFTKKIETKYIITKDKTLKSERNFDVNLKKGDIIQGISTTFIGDMANDSGTTTLEFTDKSNNVFRVRIDYRGFERFFEEYQEKPKGIKAIFKNDFIWKSGSKSTEGMIGGAPESITYKKGDSLAGLGLSLSSDKKQVISNMGNYTVQIPIENVQLLNDDGTPISNSTTDIVPQTFLQKNKTNLLIAGALVLGYFAYKKFNK